MHADKLNKMKKYIIGVLLAYLPLLSATGQEEGITPVKQEQVTTELSNETITLSDAADKQSQEPSKRELRRQEVAKRNLHYNILGGPSYTPDFGLLLGGSALMTFSMHPGDSTLRRSVVPITIAFLFEGGLNLMSKPQLFFKGDRFRIFGQFAYKNTQETTCAVTAPANTATAACSSTLGSSFGWARAISF